MSETGCPAKQPASVRIRKAARKLFYKFGYDAVTTDMLASEARVSKSTIYGHFANKSELLAAVVEAESERFRQVSLVIPDEFAAYYECLMTFGRGLLTLLSDPEIQRFEHLMISEARTHPSGAEIFYGRAHQATEADLTRLIAAGQACGTVEQTYTAQELADCLCAVWRGNTHARMQLDLEDHGYGDIDHVVARGLDLVLGLKPPST